MKHPVALSGQLPWTGVVTVCEQRPLWELGVDFSHQQVLSVQPLWFAEQHLKPSSLSSPMLVQSQPTAVANLLGRLAKPIRSAIAKHFDEVSIFLEQYPSRVNVWCLLENALYAMVPSECWEQWGAELFAVDSVVVVSRLFSEARPNCMAAPLHSSTEEIETIPAERQVSFGVNVVYLCTHKHPALFVWC
jgi:hypothetical protein